MDVSITHHRAHNHALFAPRHGERFVFRPAVLESWAAPGPLFLVARMPAARCGYEFRCLERVGDRWLWCALESRGIAMISAGLRESGAGTGEWYEMGIGGFGVDLLALVEKLPSGAQLAYDGAVPIVIINAGMALGADIRGLAARGDITIEELATR